MALTYNLTAIPPKTYKKFCTDGKHMTKLTEDIIFATPRVGMSQIRNKSDVKKFIARLAMYHKAWGDPQEQWYPFSVEQVSAHIGMYTNASNLSHKEFLETIKGAKKRRAEYVAYQKKAAKKKAAKKNPKPVPVGGAYYIVREHRIESIDSRVGREHIYEKSDIAGGKRRRKAHAILRDGKPAKRIEVRPANVWDEREFWDPKEALEWARGKIRLNEHRRRVGGARVDKRLGISEGWDYTNTPTIVTIEKRQMGKPRRYMLVYVGLPEHQVHLDIKQPKPRYFKFPKDDKDPYPADWHQRNPKDAKKKVAKKKVAKKKATKKKAARKKTPTYQLLINRCQKLWDHYCERPSKSRLKPVLEHLEKMKASTSKKVADERKRCLRVANKEARRLKMK